MDGQIKGNEKNLSKIPSNLDEMLSKENNIYYIMATLTQLRLTRGDSLNLGLSTLGWLMGISVGDCLNPINQCVWRHSLLWVAPFSRQEVLD